MEVNVEKQMNIAKTHLLESENKLTEFKKKNPVTLDTPEIQLERMRILRDVEVNQEVFITLRNQFEISKLEQSKERLFINILDDAYPSANKAYPKIFITLIFTIIIGYFISIFSTLIFFNFKKSID